MITYEILEKLAQCKYANKIIPLIKDAVWPTENPETYYLIAKLSGKPWPEAEDTIARTEKYSYYYAKYVLKGRFEKGEAAISRSPSHTGAYVSWVLTDMCGMDKDTAWKMMLEKEKAALALNRNT